MLYQGTPYLTTEPPSSIYQRADPPDPAQVSNHTLVGVQCLHVESRLRPVLGFVFSAASSWPESLIAVLGRRAIHVFFVVALCAPPPQMFVHRDLARPLSFRAATPHKQACSVTQHLSLLGHNRESGGVGGRLCGRDCIVYDVCR